MPEQAERLDIERILQEYLQSQNNAAVPAVPGAPANVPEVPPGTDIQSVLDMLLGDFTSTVEGYKTESKTAYQEAIEAIQGFYAEAADRDNAAYTDQYNTLGDNVANLGIDFNNTDLANQWEADTNYLTEAADSALATDLSWFEKMSAVQQDLYNAMLTEMAAQVALGGTGGVVSGGGSSGGGGGGGGRSSGSGSSSSSSSDDLALAVNPDLPVGDLDRSETGTIDQERDLPGFIETMEWLVQNGALPDEAEGLARRLINENAGSGDNAAAQSLEQSQRELNEMVEQQQAAQRLLDDLNAGLPIQMEGYDGLIKRGPKEFEPEKIDLGLANPLSTGFQNSFNYIGDNILRNASNMAANIETNDAADWAARELQADIDSYQYTPEAYATVQDLFQEFSTIFGPVVTSEDLDYWYRWKADKIEGVNQPTAGGPENLTPEETAAQIAANNATRDFLDRKDAIGDYPWAPSTGSGFKTPRTPKTVAEVLADSGIASNRPQSSYVPDPQQELGLAQGSGNSAMWSQAKAAQAAAAKRLAEQARQAEAVAPRPVLNNNNNIPTTPRGFDPRVQGPGGTSLAMPKPNPKPKKTPVNSTKTNKNYF